MTTNTHLNRNVYIIINPSARSGRGHASLHHRLRPSLRDRGLRVSCVVSESPAHFCDLLRAAQDPSAGWSAVGIAGGDGTVTLALQALKHCEQRVPLAIVPTGSGNDFVHDVTGSRDLRDAISLLRDGTPRWVDIGEAVTAESMVQPFCCVASVGLDEQALRVIHGSRWPRSAALNLYGALAGLWRYQPVSVSIEWDAGSFVGPISFCAVTNTRSYGGGFRISPAAQIDDGRLDLCIVPQLAKPLLLWRFPHILRGTHGALSGIVQAQTRSVRIAPVDASARLPLCLDGDLPTSHAPATLRAVSRRLLVLAPAPVPQTLTPQTSARKEAA